MPTRSTVHVGSIPHPVMGTTRDYCRYIKALIITIGGIDLIYTVYDLGFRV